MNIAFGIDKEKIDTDRIYECLKMTKLDSWVNSLSEGLDTLVGDKGIESLVVKDRE